MSQETQISFTCPKCQAKSKTKVYTSVDVTLEPKLRQQVVDKKINRVSCPKCDFSTLHAAPFLYQDHQRDFMVQLASDEQFKRADVEAAFEDLEGETQEAIRTRRVRSYEELIEKLFILEAGLDDRVLEVLKLQLKQNEPDLKAAPVAFASAKKDELEFHTITEKGIGRFQVPTASFNELKSALLEMGLEQKEKDQWLVVDAEYAEKLVERLDPPQH